MTDIRWSEAQVQSRLAQAVDWRRNLVCCNVMVSYQTEADFLVLTKNNRLWEFEIKVTRADWKADNLKERRYLMGWCPARFYYAIPMSLLDGPDHTEIPSWVNPAAGVVALFDDPHRGRGRPRVWRWIRQAKIIHRAKAGPDVRLVLLEKNYKRHWDHVAPRIAEEAEQTLVIEQPTNQGERK